MSRFTSATMIVIMAMLIVQGCGNDTTGPGRPHHALGLEKYQAAVLDGMPIDRAAAKGLDAESLRVLVDKVLNLEHEPGNLVRESGFLDALIDEINLRVTADNEPNEDSDLPSVVVVPNPDQTLTLPFFGDQIAIDYLVRLDDSAQHGSKYAGYSMDESSQTVVLFQTPGTGTGTPSDHVLYYGKKAGGTVEIWQALIGVDAQGEWYKAWAFKVRILGDEGRFEFAQGGLGYFEDSLYGFTQCAAGLSRDHFVFRARENSAAQGNLDVANLYDYADGQYDVVDHIQLGGYGNNGGPIASTDLTRPESLDVADWQAIIDFVSVIGDPDDNASVVPMSLETFHNGFIRSKFD